MKSRYARISNCLLVACVYLLCSGAYHHVYAADKPIVLKYTDLYTTTHQLGQAISVEWINKIEKRTEGRIKIQHYPGQQMAKTQEFPTLLTQGVADLALLVPNYYAGKYVMNSFRSNTALFVKATEPQVLELLLKMEALPEIEAEFKKFNMAPLVHWILDPAQIELTSDLYSLADFKKKSIKVRSSGGAETLLLAKAGLSPVAMPSPEVYMALQTKVLDGTIMHLTSFLSWKWHEVCKYVVSLNAKEYSGGLRTGLGWIAVNRDSWNKIPKDLQKIILDVSKEHSQVLATRMKGFGDDSKAELAKMGITFREMSREDSRTFIGNAKPIFEQEWVKGKGEAGIRVAENFKRISTSMGIYPF